MPLPLTAAVILLGIGTPAAAVTATASATQSALHAPGVNGDAAADLGSPTFAEFVARYGRSYRPGSAEYRKRSALFERRLADIKAINADPARLWTAGINTFTDFTDTERVALLGWREVFLEKEDEGAIGVLLEEGDESERPPLPLRINWTNLTAARRVPQQGSCGSCWAMTTAAVLEAHHEISRGVPRRFSAQELLSCVPNPRKCGGAGGCSGATVELGMAYALRHGLSNDSAVPYHAREIPCDSVKKMLEQSGQEPSPAGGGAFGLTGFHRLPRNKESPLVRAVVERGPVAVSVAAAGWISYHGGIYNSCAGNYLVDHAVTLYGYSQTNDEKHRYWLIRNSWGTKWGERGFIRLLRLSNEDAHCGVDKDPQQGVGCQGGPRQVTVCGNCGVLYDSVVPQFELADAVKGHPARTTGTKLLVAVGADAVPRLVRRERGGDSAGDSGGGSAA